MYTITLFEKENGERQVPVQPQRYVRKDTPDALTVTERGKTYLFFDRKTEELYAEGVEKEIVVSELGESVYVQHRAYPNARIAYDFTIPSVKKILPLQARKGPIARLFSRRKEPDLAIIVVAEEISISLF